MATTFSQPLIVTAQDFTILNGATLLRDREVNSENQFGEGFDEFGLRENYSGTGYVDLNGSEGDKLSFTFDAEPGTYQVTMRAAASSTREVLLRTEDGVTTDAAGPTVTNNTWPWNIVTFEVAVGGTEGVSSSHTITIAQTTGQGPNIDAVAVGNVGQAVSFFPPALEETAFSIVENENVVGQITATDGDEGAVVTTAITGGADEKLFELTDAGELRFVAAPDFEANGSAASDNAYVVEITSDDGVDRVAQAVTVQVTNDPELPEPVIDQRFADGESGTIAPAAGAASFHRVQDDPDTAEGPPNRTGADPLDAFGLRPGYTGTGYTDFNGTNESVTWQVEVDEAGAYDLHVRFASTDNPADLRPLDLTVGGGDAQRLTFDGQGFANWVERAPVKVALEAGVNVVTLSIPQGFSNGPNVDAIAVTSVGAAPDFAAPAFAAQAGDVSVQENVAGPVADLGATVADGDDVTYALEGADAAAFAIDADGALSFAGAPDFEAPTDAGEDNVYDVTVAATADGPTARQSLSVTVTNVEDEGPTGITLTAQDVAENEAGAVVAAITVDGGTPSAGDFATSNDATYRVVEEGGALTLRLQPTVSLDREADAQPSVTVFLDDLASAEFAPAPLDVDEAPVLSAATQPVDENDAGAVVASITVDDPDVDAAYTADDFDVGDDRFEVVEQDGFKLSLRDGQSLDFEAGAPTVTVTLAGVAVDVVPDVNNLAESLQVLFDEGAITSYGTGQDRPAQGGTGASVAGGVGGEVTLDGNLWKRAAVDPFAIEQGTVLRVTIDVAAVGEAVGIGFDLDDDPFDLDATVYQIAGPQTVRRFVDVRTPESTNGTGTFSFEIDLSAHAGATVSSLVLVADDDKSSDGLGRVTFSNVEITAAEDGGNSDPYVVGGGVADFTIDEGSPVEIDLPFTDDDGDALTYDYAVTLDGQPVEGFPLVIEDGVLTGPLGTTAPGAYQITATATDNKGGTVATDTFVLTVENVNQAPEADPNPGFEPYFGKVGEELASIAVADFAGAFADPDGDALVLSVTGLPAGLIFDADEGVIYGTPTEAGDGTFTVVATEVGAEGLTASIEVVLEIDAPGPGDVISIEAEDFTGLGSGSTGFFATGQAGASGDRLIRTNPNVDGAVETVLSQNGVAPGWYTVAIDVYDELDGTAEFTLTVGGVRVSPDGATFDDAGTFTDEGAARGNAGQVGNRKTISFAQEVYVEEGTVLSLTGRADGELLRTDRVVLTRVEVPNEAPGAASLTGDPVAENAAGASVGVLSSVDPDGDDAAIAYSVDAGSIFEVVGTELRLKAGESLDFEAGASVPVQVTATDAGGASTTTTLTVAVADVNEAPEAPTLIGGSVAENAAGAVIGTLGAIDPEDGAISFSVSDPRFVVEGATLRLADGVSLDHEAAEPVAVDVTVSDGVSETVRTFDIDVTDANDAPVLGDAGALGDLAVENGTESRTDLSVLAATDQDAGDTVSYGARAAGTGALPAGIAVVDAELVVGDAVAAGTYAVEIFATDGTLESESVTLNVTVGDPAPFETVVIQAEAFALVPDATATTADDNLIRTESQNWERDGSPLNPEPNDTPPNTNDGTFNALGLRPGYSGTGYLDINGGDAGAQATFDFDAPAGQYDLHVRYANGAQVRPISFEVGGQTYQIADTRTDVDEDGDGTADAGSGWYNWSVAILRITVTGDGPHTVTVNQDGAQGAPNIDAVAVSLPGEPVQFVEEVDESADADAFPLNLDGPADEVPAGQAGSIDFIVSGRDDDVVKVEISFDGGATRTDVTDRLSAEGELSVDGSTLGTGAQVARIIVTDAAGNEAFDDYAFAIEDDGPAPFAPVTIQGEDATITDTVGTTGSALTVALREGDSDAFGNEVGVERTGALGDPAGYADFGTNPGDTIAFTLTVPAAGTYTATFRYANGGETDRPLDLSVNGGAASSTSFAPTPNIPASGGEPALSGWNNWTEVTVELTLAAGANTVELAIPAGGSNGPNIDQVTFAAGDGDDGAGAPGAQRFEDVIKVNFEAPLEGNGAFDAPAGYRTPEGYESDTGAAYAERGNGFTYGWVDVDDADGTVTATPASQPTGSARYKDAAPEASDLQKTYLHFDYPGTPDGDRERAWEIEVENGTYELSVAIGDTAGKYDSNYVLNVEGQQFGDDWEPVNLAGEKVVQNYDASDDGLGFRSTVHTGIVQVTDGRLTIDGIDGQNVEIQWLDLQKIPDLTPNDGRTADLDYSRFVAAVAASTEEGQVSIEIGEDGELPLDINPTADIVVGVDLQATDHRGPDVNFTDGVRLVETLTGVEVPITVQVTGGSDGLTISPVGDLKEFTSYTLRIEDVLDLGNLFDADAPVRQFQDYSTTFVTGEAPEVVAREVAFTDQLVLDGFAQGGVAITSLEIGPEDGKLYASSIAGTIQRWELNADGTLDVAGAEVLSLGYFQDTGRSIVGMAFDPQDAGVIWVTDNATVPTDGKNQSIDDFSGRLSKITLGADGDFATASAETYLTGLPRSGGDHVTNSIEFRANPDAGAAGEPDFLLYFMQGSNTAAGRPDNAWGFRPERLLNAAALEVDHTRDAPDGGFDVQTEPYQAGVNVPTYRDPNAVFEANGTVDGFYDPFAQDAVLRIFGEGIRNGYDLVWHTNGNLYVPTNGTARGGNTLDDPRTPGVNEQLSNLDKQYDYLFQVQEGGYYGHPNELLDHYIVNGGAAGVQNGYAGKAGDNAANTSDGGSEYDASVLADPDYDAGGAYSLDFNKSPNGAIEYRSDVFGDNLQGAVLFAQFSQGDNVRVINVDPVTGRVTGDSVLRRPDGTEIDEWTDPLDIIENPATGQLYMVTLNRTTGESKIVLLNPAPGGAVADADADVGGDLTLTVLDASDASAVLFGVTGLDDDIETVTVSFDGGAPQAVTLDAQGRFTRDLQSATGAVTATLVVRDEVPNTASATVTFTPGDASGAVFIDARQFTLLDTDSGSVIRLLEDPSTHENANSGNDVSPKNGLNDGHDGTSYIDPNGGAEAKASFVFDAAGAGTYELSFRMASNSDRAVAIEVNGHSVPIAVNTGSFTGWADFPITLALEDGPNTITIVQTTSQGPNIDSVTVTPIAVAADVTADEDGDLSVTLADGSDRAATVFDVTGLDDDIETVTVAFGDGPARQVTVTDGSFTVDTTALSGAVTVTLTVRDEVPNTASATASVDFAAVVADDGTATIDGVEYVLYEAETASLDGQDIVGDDAGEDGRGAQGGAFVDFDGTADQTITWTVEVAEDGTYGVDILYALAAGKDARPMALSVDGTSVETLPFAANSNAGETDWGPQSTVLTLTAGVHTISVTAPGANGPNVDQLRITQGTVEPAIPGDPDADIEIRSQDPAFFDDRLHFSWLDNDSGSSPDRQFKETASVQISSSGTSDLVFEDATITGPFELADPAALDGLILAGGESIVVEVLFDRDAYTSGPSSVTGVFEGALTLRTNDAEDRVATVDLAGFWQQRDEGGWEPNVNEVWQVFGFGNFIEGLSLNGGGENSVLNRWDLYIPADDTEVLSPYFRIADGETEARVTQIAAFHGDGGANLSVHAPGDKGAAFGIGTHAGDENQTFLPLKGNGSFLTGTFDAGTVPDAWEGNDIFGFRMAGLSTDPTLNDSGSQNPTQAQLDALYPGAGYTVSGGEVFEADGTPVENGYTVRMFQAVDEAGNAIPNVYLGVMDYTGINYDYNDNMFIVEGVTAVGNGAVLSIAGLDAAAADDRLVFSAIDNPKTGQVTRDTATFEVVNDGTGAMGITGVTVDGAFTVTGLAAGDTIAAGASATVTVTFDGTDGVNDNAAVLFEGGIAIATDAGTRTIALSGLAQLESEGGEEPTVAQIAEAFGYGTDVAQGQLANGGAVETVGDEVFLPYLERLDGSKPVEIIQLAAYLNQGNVARLSSHALQSAELTELFAADDNQGQTLLPDGLVPGAGDTGSAASATIDDDGPFGLKVTVDGRPTYASWTDPEANRIDPQFGQLVDDAAGHLIRFFQAEDATGNVIEGTFIGIQDYPGAGNYDYNDHMFLVKNVRPHDLTAAEDANGNGVNDALETDADEDGLVAFFDADDAATGGGGGEPAKGDYVVGFNVGGPAVAAQQGLGGVALRGDGDPLISYAGDGATRAPGTDDAGNPNGANALPGAFQTYRDGTDWTTTVSGLTDGEYVVVLHTQETYHATSGQRVFDLRIDGVTVADDLDPFAVAGGDAGVAITALVQVTGGSFTVALDAVGSDGVDNAALNAITVFQSAANPGGGLAAPGNAAPTTTGIAGVPEAVEGEAFDFDVSSFFDDPDAGDTLTFSADLPAGLSISTAGVISGTPVADGSFAITVTASDGQASVASSFTLVVDDAPAPAVQTPFPGPDAPVIGADAVTIDAGDFDAGGQGVSWNDDPGLNGTQSARTDTDVELVGAAQDIGYVEAGEWVEYTVNVAEAGTYDLSVNAKTPIGGNTVTVSIEGGAPLATFALPDSNGGSDGFGGTTFAETPIQQVTLEAGEQTLRVAFDGAPADNGYLLDYRGLTLDKAPDVVANGPIGEAGRLDVSQVNGSTWTSVSFSQALDNASVVVGPLTSNDGSPATVRVRNVTDTGFEVQIDEWDYLDGAHGSETLQWIALEAGTHEIDGRTVVAGSGTATGNDSAMFFGTDAFASGPLVFAQVASDLQPNAVTAQINSVSSTGFVLDLDRQERDQRDLGLAHGTETVDWIAVEGGGHASDGSFSGLMANVTTRGVGVNLPLAGAADDFVFLADMQQEKGIDAATVRLKSIGSQSWTLFIEEEKSRDAELRHALEDVGYFGIEDGLIFEDISIG